MKKSYVKPESSELMLKVAVILAYSMAVEGNTSDYGITENEVKETFDVSDFWGQNAE